MPRPTRPGIVEATEELAKMSRHFGPKAVASKTQLLDQLLACPRIGRAQAARLDGLLGFMLAYPDSPVVRASARRLVDRLPDPRPITHPYSYEVVARLLQRFPLRLEIAWTSWLTMAR